MSMVAVHGQYPDARFFNFSTYTATGSFIATLFDAQISADAGSRNHFAQPGPDISGNYTVTIGASTPGSSNVLTVGGSRVAFVVYRVYLPDSGLDRTGRVGVPAVTHFPISRGICDRGGSECIGHLGPSCLCHMRAKRRLMTRLAAGAYYRPNGGAGDGVRFLRKSRRRRAG
jgi:hypothetical protein